MCADHTLRIRGGGRTIGESTGSDRVRWINPRDRFSLTGLTVIVAFLTELRDGVLRDEAPGNTGPARPPCRTRKAHERPRARRVRRDLRGSPGEDEREVGVECARRGAESMVGLLRRSVVVGPHRCSRARLPDQKISSISSLPICHGPAPAPGGVNPHLPNPSSNIRTLRGNTGNRGISRDSH